VAVARAVAVLGEAAALPTVTAFTGLEERQVAEAIAALARIDILAPEPPLGFVHPLVGDAVYRELAAGERELQHAHAATVLRRRDAPAELVAAQLLRTTPRGDQAAVATLREAAASAARKGAPDSAMSYLRRALEEPPAAADRAGVLLELGLAEGLIDGAAAAEHLSEAYGGIEDPVQRAFTANLLARVLLFARGPAAAREVARRALDDLPEELANERGRLRAVALMATHFGAGDLRELDELVPYRTSRREDLTMAGEASLAGLAAWAWLRSGGPAGPMAELALASLASGELVREDNGLLSVPPYVVLASVDHPATLDAWEQALIDGHRQGSLYGISALHLWRGYALLLRGQLPEAVESLEQAVEEFRNWGHGLAADLYTSSLLCAAHLARGDLDAARAALAQAPAPAVDRLGPLARTDGAGFWRHAQIELLLAERRYEEALAEARAFPSTFEHWHTPAVFRPLGLAAEALLHLGRADEALPLAEHELELARAVGAPRAVSQALRTVAAARGEAGLPLLEEAVRIVDPSVARLELARALADLGSALRRARRPSEARDPLRRALEVGDACGAAGLVEHVRAELAATGARPRTTAAAGVESLTASERRVVQFAVEGQSNRDIAQALFVTPKTVEVHLSNAYKKLGVRSRRDLYTVIGSEGTGVAG
jgi:DNA-binding CsgD family transcriptional regulator